MTQSIHSHFTHKWSQTVYDNLVQNITDSYFVQNASQRKADGTGKTYLRSDIVASHRHMETLAILTL